MQGIYQLGGTTVLNMQCLVTNKVNNDNNFKEQKTQITDKKIGVLYDKPAQIVRGAKL